MPEHPAARQARSRAWQQIAAIGPGTASQWPQRGARSAPAQAAAATGTTIENESTETQQQQTGNGGGQTEGIVWLSATARQDAGLGASPAGAAAVNPTAARNPWVTVPPRIATPSRPLARDETAGLKGRFLLWVDAVGGYLVCLDERIVLGRAGSDSHADVPSWATFRGIMRHSCVNGESYLLQAHHASFVNGKPVGRAGDPARRRHHPPGHDRRARISTAQSGECDGAVVDSEPAPACPWLLTACS